MTFGKLRKPVTDSCAIRITMTRMTCCEFHYRNAGLRNLQLRSNSLNKAAWKVILVDVDVAAATVAAALLLLLLKVRIVRVVTTNFRWQEQLSLFTYGKRGNSSGTNVQHETDLGAPVIAGINT